MVSPDDVVTAASDAELGETAERFDSQESTGSSARAAIGERLENGSDTVEMYSPSYSP